MKNTGASIFYLKLSLLMILACPVFSYSQPAEPEQQLLRLKIYHLDNLKQEQRVDQYLQSAYLPALHRMGLQRVGVFKPLGQDTTSDKRVYVLTAFDSFQQFESVAGILAGDQQYRRAGSSFIEASPDNPPYRYIETILLRAFPKSPRVQAPDLDSPNSERVYELRSYGSPTEALNKNKVEMFNQGGEVALFSKLNFNVAFYGNVISGSDMPNLMYMPTFDSMEARDTHWDQFFGSPTWKKISSMEKYQNNVSRVDIQFLRPSGYSDL